MANGNIVNARGAGLVNGLGLSSPTSKNTQDYNAFDRSQTFYQTQRFGEVNPIFSRKFISGDKVRIRSMHELRSFTLKSPLMSNIYMHRGFFSVPLQAIYHNTFKVFFVNPVKGSDINDTVKPKFALQSIRGNSSFSLFNHLLNNKSVVNTGSSDIQSLNYLNNLFLLMQIYSRDGLLQKLGYSVNCSVGDAMFDIFLKIFNGGYQGVSTCLIDFVNQNQVSCLFDLVSKTIISSGNTHNVSFEEFRSIFYDLVNNKFEIKAFFFDGFTDQTFNTDYDAILSQIPIYRSDDYVNLEKLIAYQYIIAQFYSNSFVDDIHDARQWENNNLNIIDTALRTSTSSSFRNFSTQFSLNGVNYHYDLVCQQISNILSFCFHTNNTSYPATTRNVLCLVFRNLFEQHYSLRTSDYFVDSRTQPLAVGDVNIAVNNNVASAIDVNIGLWRQRFANAVNRIPYHAELYLKEIFGFEPTTKEPKPFFISKERFLISGQEVENTADTEQGKIVTNLRTEDSRYIFETKVTEPCVIMGISSYSLDYAYSSSMDREFVEFDREDNFNPFAQHFGDQPLFARELNNDTSKFSLSYPFAYQLRYYQYKRSVDHAAGGFIDYLPSWAALYDKNNGFDENFNLNPFFIRNHNIDLDRFYSSLSGFNPCEYFHFIAKFHTICKVNSKQQKYPSLL